MGRVDCTENYLNSLPPTHQTMLIRYRQHLLRIRECIDQNYKIIRKLIQKAENLFHNEHTINLPIDSHSRRPNIRLQDHESVSIFGKIKFNEFVHSGTEMFIFLSYIFITLHILCSFIILLCLFMR